MKSVISYFMVLFSAIVYMILFDRDAGGIMTIFLIVIPFVSVMLTLMAKKKLVFSFESEDDIINKKDFIKFYMKVKKDTILPVPIISFSIKASERFAIPKYDTYRFSMSEDLNIDVEVEVMPEICGPAEITITNVFISDYLGVFKFKIKRAMNMVSKIYILPELKEIQDGGEILRSIYSTLPDNDDDETSKSYLGNSSFPGYEYREYIPGDPLKKVNWKLSSKKNQLFVRMDETSGITLPNIILDTSNPSENENTRDKLKNIEMIIESSLSLLMLCIKNGIQCTYSYKYNDDMRKEDISSLECIERLANTVCRMEFNNNDLILENSGSAKSSDVNIVYTLKLTNDFINSVEQTVLEGNCAKIIMPEFVYGNLNISLSLSDMWLIKEDYNIYKIS